MDKPKLAIVIPYFKLTYFEETLKSLKAQTNQNFSLYIGNDNSPEDPQYLIEKYSDIITLYKKFETNLGGVSLTKQWERCIDTMVKDEEWIMLLCDDDLLSVNYVNKFYLHLDRVINLNISLIKYNCKVINTKGDVVQGPYTYNQIEDSVLFFKKLFFNKAFSTLSENVFRKDKYQKYRYQNFELAFGSDAIAVLEYSEFSNIYMIVDEYMTFRRSDINISGNRSDKNLQIRKMKGNTSYMYYLLNNYSNKFDYLTKLEMCKMLYRNFRVAYRGDFKMNIKCFINIINILSLKDVFKLVKRKDGYR